MGRAQGGGEYIDRNLLLDDVHGVETALEDVKQYADQHVAHTKAQPVPARVTMTLNLVHGAIEHIGGVFNRYHVLLTAESFTELEPVIQDDWMAVFRVPWIKSPDG